MDDLKIKHPSFSIAKEGPTLDRKEVAGQKSFFDTLNESIEKVNEIQKTADSAVEDLAVGNTQNIHSTMIAMEKADVSFQLMMQVRNKLVSAYEEIMRMQV
ncbi:MAG: flagellar hook-basal body complex protein FliE [Nitrospirota bacterium]